MTHSSSARVSMSRCVPTSCPRADATSLLLAGSGPGRLDRTALLAAILDEFGDLLERWVRAGGDIEVSGLRADYLASCSTVGSRVRLLLPGGAQVLARAVDVAVDGALVVEDDDGSAPLVHRRRRRAPAARSSTARASLAGSRYR